MSNKPDLSKLMQQAKEMQNKLQEAQKDLANMRVTGSAGGDMVQVVMNGRHQVVEIKHSADLQEEDFEFVMDVLKAAFNNAVEKVEKESQKRMKDITSSMGLPDQF